MSLNYELHERITNSTGAEFTIPVGEYNSIESILEAISLCTTIKSFMVYTEFDEFTVDKL